MVIHLPANFDYDSRSVVVRFVPNQPISCVLIDIVDDRFSENTEEFVIEIVNTPDDGINTGGDGTATVTIIDNDVRIVG